MNLIKFLITNFRVIRELFMILMIKSFIKFQETSTSADITYSTPQGGTGQRTVSLPYNLRFDSFPDSFYYISAQNNNEFGNITVEIYYEDNKRATDFCSGSFCIATASASYR